MSYKSCVKSSLNNNRVVIIIDILFSIILFFLCSIELWLLLNNEPVVWVDLLADDAYYYLGIARNIVEQGKSSFLPPFETNGYQPLWLIIITILGFIFGTSETALVIELICVSLFFVSLFIFFSKKLYGSAFPAIIVALAFPAVMHEGMETAMLPAFAILFISSSSFTGKGFFGSLLFLTRLDALSLIVAKDLFSIFRKREVNLQHYLIIVPVVFVYVVINYYFFGIAVPVSGLAKSIGNNPGENILIGLGYIRSTRFAVFIFFIVFIVSSLRKLKISELHFLEEYIVLLITCLIILAYYGINSGWPLWPWYFWAPFLITYFALMEVVYILNEVAISENGYFKAGLFVFLVFGICPLINELTTGIVTNRFQIIQKLLMKESLPESFGRKNRELADLIIQHKVPKNSFFAMGDKAGSFGFFLGNNFRFIHTEGLVGPINYYKAMVKDEGLNFIEGLDVDYWIADREKFIESGGGIIGVIEPVQGLSSHQGPYIICFPNNAIVLDQSYDVVNRFVFDYKKKVDCPEEIITSFTALKNKYFGIRKYTLPLEYERRGFLGKLLNP